MTSHSLPSDRAVDPNSSSALAIACFVMAVGGLEFSIMPLYLGGMATHLLFTEQQVGFIGSAYLVGFTLTCFSAIFWSHRVNWRTGVIFAALIATGSYLIAAATRNYQWILVLTFLVGCARGIFYAISVCSLGDTENTERAFALGSLSTMVLAGLGMLALPYVMQSLLICGLFVPLIGVSVLSVAMVRWLPIRAIKQAETVESTASGSTLHVFVALGGLLAFWIGMCGIWSFLERIGNANGLSPQAIGTVLAVSYAGVILAAIIVAWLGDRIGRAAPIFTGMLTMLVGIFCMDRPLTFATYMTASIIFQVGWIICYPFTMAVISRADTSGRYVPLIAAAQGLGASLGAGIGGTLIGTSEDYSGIYRMAVVCLVLSMVTFGWVLFRLRKQEA
jgi:predicted MFS family arabinose efflux permease